MGYQPTCTAVTAIVSLLFCLVSTARVVDGGLTITLEEADGTLAHNIRVQVTNVTANQSRRINLALGRGYLLHCQSEEVDGSRETVTAVWYAGDQEVRTASKTDPNPPLTYSYLEANQRTLVLSNFTVNSVGVYRCRERGSSNTDGVGVVLGPGNPTVITGAQNKVLRHGQQDSNARPILVAFITGSPYPSRSDIVWRLNDQNLPEGIVENGNELILPAYVRSELEGRYTCHVTTTQGNASADIYVTLIYPPSITISPSGPHALQINSSVTFYCEDSAGVPPPTFMWSYYNGSILTSGDHITIADDLHHRSSLTITNFQPSHSGEYMCTASNAAGSSHNTVTLSVLQLSPPAPPTVIHVNFTSACTVLIEWVWPQVTPSNHMALADYVVFETKVLSESDWTEVGRANHTQNSVVARMASNRVNTKFQLRARCVNNIYGAGAYYTVTDTFTLFSEAALPHFRSLSTEVLSSSAVQLSWHLPEQDCFNFTSVAISCQAAAKDDGIDATRSTAVTQSSVTKLAMVTGLIPETPYNCSIASNLTESEMGQLIVQVRTYAPELAATYPEFGLFELLLNGISDCEQWKKEAAADEVALAVANGVEELCRCGFTTSNIEKGELQCSSSSTNMIIYHAEMHETPQAHLPRLISHLKEWVGEEQSLLLQSQPVRIDTICFDTCTSPGGGETQTNKPFNTYAVIGITTGLALALVIGVILVIFIISLLVSRHRRVMKLNASSTAQKKSEVIPSTTNFAAVTEVNFEELDRDAEPQYESMGEYDRLPPNSSRVVSKPPQKLYADSVAFEAMENSHS